MTHAAEEMVNRGHLKLISRHPLRLQPVTETGIKFFRDTKGIGVAGYMSRAIETIKKDNL